MKTPNPEKHLSQKLGLKENQKVCFLNVPYNYIKLVGEIPPNNQIDYDLNGSYNFIHYFTKDKMELINEFPSLKTSIFQNGLIWISWPKKSSEIETNLNFNVVQQTGLNNGLVDVKVCSIDKDWSGLKFVFRLADRKKERVNE